MRSRVDLPQPEGPTSVMNSLRPISSDTSCSAVTWSPSRLLKMRVTRLSGDHRSPPHLATLLVSIAVL